MFGETVVRFEVVIHPSVGKTILFGAAVNSFGGAVISFGGAAIPSGRALISFRATMTPFGGIAIRVGGAVIPTRVAVIHFIRAVIPLGLILAYFWLAVTDAFLMHPGGTFKKTRNFGNETKL